ncbi:PriCT-2 domain-containing protein [Cysteiniphilum sp. 6C5]|uniref:PriCT-2 domain-containing protein n=1 Tax=unclassified Cysteiniphilum TaxID=2610889 RepID=UPI003F86F452
MSHKIKIQNYLKEYGYQLIQNNYSIVPINYQSKRPCLPEWTVKCKTPSQHDIGQWFMQFPNAGIGILTAQTPAVDIDTLNEAYSNKMAQFIAELFNISLSDMICRIGKSPKLLIPCHCNQSFSKMVSKVYIDEHKQKHQVEILGDGQQFVAFGIHPETKQPYQWVNNLSLLDVQNYDLPLLTREKAQHIIEYFEQNTPVEWKLIDNKSAKNDVSNKNMTAVNALINIKQPLNLTEQQITMHLDLISPEEYDTWIKVGMALHHQFNGNEKGFKFWDTWSSQGLKYKANEMRAKWQSFKRDYADNKAAITMASIIDLSHKEKIVKRAKVESLEDFLKRYILCRGKYVIDLCESPDKEPLTLQEFREDKRHAYEFITTDRGKNKRIQIADLWQDRVDKLSVRDTTYYPNDERFIQDDDGTFLYNLFYWPRHQLAQQNLDLTPFYEHINYLFPIREEAEWFLDWLAFSVQAPHLRSPITPLHINRFQGTGRGLLVELLFSIFGESNVQSCSIKHFSDDGGSKSQFNGYLYRSIMCVIEESKEPEQKITKYNLADRIKSVLTDKRQNINEKFKQPKTRVCYTNFLIMSNNLDAIVLRDSDRRFNVFYCGANPKPEEYYLNLSNWFEKKEVASALFFMLRQRPINIQKFKSQKIMKNNARKMLIESTTGDYELIFNQIIDNKLFNWATIQHIHEAILAELPEDDKYQHNFESKKHQLKKLLQNCPHATPTRKQFKINGKAERPWCLNINTLSWEEKNVELIRAELQKNQQVIQQKRKQEDNAFHLA